MDGTAVMMLACTAVRSSMVKFYPNCNINRLQKLICNRFSTTITATPASIDKEEKVKVGQWNINYLKIGNGPHNVLCLPGALGSIWSDFKPQIEGFDREKFTLVVWDPPGYGKSRPPDKDFNPDFYDKDAVVAYDFMKVLELPKYSLLGWSDGGITGMILAAKYPAVMNKLVVWGANAFMLPRELEAIQKTKDINTWSQRMKQPMIDVYGEEFFAKYWSEWTEGMTKVFQANDGNICSHILKDIQCPTMILYGEKDPLVDTIHASHLHTNIQGSRLHLYPEGKHNIHLRYAEDFNRKVQEFLLL